MNSALDTISEHMRGAGLPETFVRRALVLARTSEGAADIFHLWMEHPEVRDEAVVQLQGMLDDREPMEQGSSVDSLTDAEQELERRLAHKAHIRSLVEAHGGVSKVAATAGIPQPSLSRLLNGPAEPRTSTLERLAAAMNLSVGALRPPAEKPPGARIFSQTEERRARLREEAARTIREQMRFREAA